MFHVKKGLYFECGSDGGVIVHVHRDDSEGAQELKDVSLTKDEWHSVLSYLEPSVAPAEEQSIDVTGDGVADTAKTLASLPFAEEGAALKKLSKAKARAKTKPEPEPSKPKKSS